MKGVKEVALSHFLKILFRLHNNVHPHIAEREEFEEMKMTFEVLRKLFEGLSSIVKEAIDMERKGEEERAVNGIRIIWLCGLIPLEEKYEYKIRLLTSHADNVLHAPKRVP